MNWAASRVAEVGERAGRQQQGGPPANSLAVVAGELSKLLTNMVGAPGEAAADGAAVAEAAAQVE